MDFAVLYFPELIRGFVDLRERGPVLFLCPYSLLIGSPIPLLSGFFSFGVVVLCFRGVWCWVCGSVSLLIPVEISILVLCRVGLFISVVLFLNSFCAFSSFVAPFLPARRHQMCVLRQQVIAPVYAVCAPCIFC